MKRNIVLSLFVVLAFLLPACAPPPTPQIVEVEKQVVVEKPVIQTVEVEKVVEKEVVVTVEVEKIVEKEVVQTVEIEVPAIPPDAKLTAWFSQSYVEGMDDVHRSQVDEFTKFTGIPVEASYINPEEFATKVNAALEAPETLPDLIQVEVFLFPLLQGAGRLLDVSDVASRLNMDEGGISPALLSGVTVDGNQYGIPWMVDPMVTYLRTDIFEAAGLEVPDTYAELAEACPQINVPGEMYCWGLNINDYADSEEAARALIWAFGGTVTDAEGKEATINSPETIAAMEYLKNLAEMDSFPPDFPTSDGYSNNLWYQTGLVAHTANSGSILAWLVENDPEITENTVLTIPLAGEDGERPMSANVFVLAATTNTEYPELAKKLLEWITSAGNGWAYIEAANYGFVSPYVGLVNRRVIQDDPALRALAETTAMSRYNSWPAPLSQATSEIYGQAVVSKMALAVMMGEMTPEEAVADAEAKVNEIIARYQ